VCVADVGRDEEAHRGAIVGDGDERGNPAWRRKNVSTKQPQPAADATRARISIEEGPRPKQQQVTEIVG
jgi:hypothetical protein